jgi:hypothetical protein
MPRFSLAFCRALRPGLVRMLRRSGSCCDVQVLDADQAEPAGEVGGGLLGPARSRGGAPRDLPLDGEVPHMPSVHTVPAQDSLLLRCRRQPVSGHESNIIANTDILGGEAAFPLRPERRALHAATVLTSSTARRGGDSSRNPGGLRCWFAVHRRASLHKQAPRAATACPAAILPASGCASAGGRPAGIPRAIRSGRRAGRRGWHGCAEALAIDSLTLPQPADTTEGGRRRFLPGRSAGVSAPQSR